MLNLWVNNERTGYYLDDKPIFEYPWLGVLEYCIWISINGRTIFANKDSPNNRYSNFPYIGIEE